MNRKRFTQQDKTRIKNLLYAVRNGSAPCKRQARRQLRRMGYVPNKAPGVRS